MFAKHILRPRIVGSFALLGIIGTAGFGFAAGNTLTPADMRAGTGEAAISGYAVTNVEYVFHDNTSDPVIDAVNFTLDGTASYVRAALNDASTMYACDSTGSNNWTCDVSDQAITASVVNKLDVLASGKGDVVTLP